MFDINCLKLYAITDSKYISENNYTIQNAVEEAILGGATIIQLREKQINNEDFLKKAICIKKITNKYNIPLIINDNIEVAIKSDADGLHLGQEDLIGKNLNQIRKQFGKEKIIGISADTIKQAIFAKENGANYIGISLH